MSESTPEASEPAVYEGGCLCGSVRYRVSGRPLSSSLCHCRSCRLASGAPSVAWFVVPLARFELLAGELTPYRSSAHVTRGFCNRCGTPLTYRHDDSPQQIELTTASLDEAELLPPWREIWLSERLPWAPSDPGVEHFPRSSRDGTGGGLATNRSMPGSAVIPVLEYPDPGEAAAWLCRAFGFVERLRIGNHRVQLDVPGGGAAVVAEGASPTSQGRQPTWSVMVRIADADEHHRRASAEGATVLGAPTTYHYGERQYSAVDPGGYVWTFSQTVLNVEPSAWGGALAQ